MAEGMFDRHMPQWVGLEPSSDRAFGPEEVTDVRWRPTAEELKAVRESHRKWVESDGQEGQKVDLSEAVLREANLSGAVLSGADLSEADLSGTDLLEADLLGADLLEADLSGTDLSEADFWRANLSGADLSSADLSEAVLREANLSGAVLSGADLSEADLLGADLSGADLSGADLSEAILSGADLLEADLSGADLSEADFWRANLSGAALSGADLSEADLSKAVLSGADLSGAGLRGADLSGAGLRRANLSGADLKEADLSEVFLPGADLSGAFLPGADLPGADLEEADLSGADLEGANLSGADLKEADLSEVLLSGADLSGADLKEADLSRAVLRRADLSKSILDNASLKEVVGLTSKQMGGSSVLLADLPPEIEEFEGLDIAKETALSTRKILISILAACGYAAAALTLRAGSSAAIELPIIGLSMNTGYFLLFTPVLLALLFAYLHLFKLQRLFEGVAQLPAIFPDGRPIDRKFPPGLAAGLLACLTRMYSKRLAGRDSPSFFIVQVPATILLGWCLVPTTLGYFAWMHPLDPARRSGSLFLFALAGFITGVAIVAYIRAATTVKIQDRSIYSRAGDVLIVFIMCPGLAISLRYLLL